MVQFQVSGPQMQPDKNSKARSIQLERAFGLLMNARNRLVQSKGEIHETPFTL